MNFNLSEKTHEAVVSGPLIGQHSPAVLITYSCDPGRGSGCIRECSFHSTCVGVSIDVGSRCLILGGLCC